MVVVFSCDSSTADKESLTAELHKLQQSHRQIKVDLGARIDQLQQFEAHRQVLEKQVHEAKLQQSSQVQHYDLW
jgi:nitrate/TMAO reductase-like tetraheme cytochrome c subunit